MQPIMHRNPLLHLIRFIRRPRGCPYEPYHCDLAKNHTQGNNSRGKSSSSCSQWLRRITAPKTSVGIEKALSSSCSWNSAPQRVIVHPMRVLKHQLRRLQKFLRRRGSSPQDAEDLVQEAVVRLFAYTRRVGEVRNTEAFL